VGTITSGVGLVSGLNYQNIVEQLIAIDARPRDQLQTRISNINAQKAAYLEISARITAMLSRLNVLIRTDSFRSVSVSSSSPSVLSASGGSGLAEGSYSFVVRALASTHQLVSRGFYDRKAPLTAGTLTIESAQARVNNATRLDELNGHTGVHRGSLKITNGLGQEAVINVSDALTVQDVVDKINAAGIQVSARVDGDRLVLSDGSGGTGGLRVQEVGGGRTASDLGFGVGHAYAPDGQLAGSSIMYLATSTPTASLNDGLGIRAAPAGGDFTIEAGGAQISVGLSDILTPTVRLERLNHGQGVRLGQVRITSRDGTLATVDLTGAKTIADIKQAIESAFGDSRITVTLTGSRLIISDKTDTSKLEAGQVRDLLIEDLSGYAARDLGIDGQSSKGKINGRDILHMTTLADVISAINYADGNLGTDGKPLVTALVAGDGRGLVLTGSGPLVVTGPAAGVNSRALWDLGFQEGTYDGTMTGARIIGSINTVMLKTLNGGSGVSGTTMQIAANGRSATLDLTGVETLAEVIDRINRATDAGGQSLGIEAAYDATGTRLMVSNLIDDSPITISGDFAESLGLAQSGTLIRSNNLQRQYISETTRLDSLNAGRGVSRGRFKITSSTGASATVNLSGSIRTLQDVIDAINDLKIGVQAGINATGDGLLITDTAGGAGTLRIEEDGGTTARDLNILGNARDGQIDGSMEFKIQIGGSDTLESLAGRIGSETTLATAALLNDGTGLAPYRLSIAARASGAAGELIVDDSDTGLAITALTRAQDARVFFGASSESGVLLTSSSNTFENAIHGLTLTINAVDDKPVTVVATRKIDTLLTALKGLVDDFNSAMERINKAGAYDAETQVAGPLQGEGTLRIIQSRLHRMFTGTVYAGGVLRRLSDVGITLESGNKLSFEEQKFRDVYQADPTAVERLFTDSEYGLAVQIKAQVEQMTDSGGLIDSQTKTLENRQELLNDRISELNEQLERKRARLLRQFQAMESALAQLQSQQTALSNLSSLANNLLNNTLSSRR